LEKLQILAGREDSSSVAHTILQLRGLIGTLSLENINVAPHAEEIRALSGSDEPWRNLTRERVAHLSHTLAPLLRISVAGTYPELQFENQTEQLALAHLRADINEIEKLRERITENLSLLPTNIPEVRPHLEALGAAQSDAF
jgi:type I restriction enzyme R subunit